MSGIIRKHVGCHHYGNNQYQCADAGATCFLGSQDYNTSRPKAFLNCRALDEQLEYYTGEFDSTEYFSLVITVTMKMIALYMFLCFGLINFSCKSNENPISNKSHSDDANNNRDKRLGYDEITLTALSEDTNEVHIEKGMPSGDYFVFYFRNISRSVMNPEAKIRGIYAELKVSENRNSPIEYHDSLKAVNYHAYSFEIGKNDWETIRRKVADIELNADSSLKNRFCEFCNQYTLGYNGKMIADKLTKDRKVEALFEYLINRYQKTLYASER